MSYKILNTDQVEQSTCKTKTCKNFELNLKRLKDSYCPKCGKKVSVITTNKETKYKDKDHVVTVHGQVYHASELQTLKSRSDKAGEIKYKKFQVQSIFAEKNNGKIVPREVNTNLPVLGFHFMFDWKLKDYNSSVKKSSALVRNLENAVNIIKKDWAVLVHELYIAREVFSNQGIKGKTFKSYYEACGLKKPTVYRWLKIAEKAEESGKTLQEQVDEIGKSGEKGKGNSIDAIIRSYTSLKGDNKSDFVSLVMQDSGGHLLSIFKKVPKKVFEDKFADFLKQTDFDEKFENLLDEYYVQYKTSRKSLKKVA